MSPWPAVLEADYLVVGAGAAGMAFTDALIDHADVSVVMVDRRHGVGGHWLDAYPFVRLHQASAFYGVASTLLGDGRIQQRRARGRPARAGDRAGDLRLLRAGAARADARVGQGRASTRAASTSATAGSCRASPGERYEVPRAVPHRRRPLPRPRDPGGDAAAVRGRRRRARDPGQRPGPARRARRAQYVDRRLGQDRDRRLHLAARQRRRPRRDLLGAAARSVDAQPGRGPARPGRLPRHGRRHRCRRRPAPRRRTTCSSGWRTPASCCASTGR